MSDLKKTVSIKIHPLHNSVPLSRFSSYKKARLTKAAVNELNNKFVLA